MVLFQHTATLGAALLLAILVAIGVFDFLALLSGGKIATVSQVVQQWARDYPVIVLLLGMVLGHLFFPGPSLTPPAPTP